MICRAADIRQFLVSAGFVRLRRSIVLRRGQGLDIRAKPQMRAGLAQLVERQFCKLDVAGSIPAAGTTISMT